MKVRKKLILALVVALMLVSSPRVSYAKTISVKVSSSSLNVRKEATSNSSVTKSLTKGTKLSVNSSKVQGTGCSSGWYKITSGTYKNNYVCSGYVTQVTTGSTSSSSSNSTSSFKAEVVNNPTLNVRAEARSTSAKKGVLKKGNIITVSKTNTSGNGCAKNWYKITEGTYKGYYVCGYYISKYSASSSSSNSTSSFKAEVVNNPTLNVRAEARSTSAKKGVLKKGNIITVSKTNTSGNGCAKNWYKITEGTYKGYYVCGYYISKYSASSSSSNSTSSFKAEVVNNPTLNVRAEARSTSAKKGVLKKGNIITVSKTNTSGNGCAKNWYKITEGTYKGYYVCGYYISKYSASSIKYVNSNDKKYVKSCSGTISKSKASKLGVSTNETFVEVDLTNQQVTLYKKGKCLIKSDAVTGQAQSKGGQKNAVDTRKGTFTIKYKKTNYYFKADDLWSDYWMPFDGGIGLHDADWRSQFGKNRTDGKKGSHGCVNLPKTAAKIIYNNVSAGTKVVVY